MNVYVASHFNTRDRILPYVERLQQMGYYITATWLTEEPKGDITQTTLGQYTETERLGFAVADVSDLECSDVIILDTIDEELRGGREVEWGAFLFGPIRFGFGVGPKRNVFHQLATRWFESWEELLPFLQALSERTGGV